MAECICSACGKPFTPKSKRATGRFCSLACYYKAGPRGPRKQTVNGKRMAHRPNHPIAPPSGTLSYSRIVLFDQIGFGPHDCFWCGTEIDWKYGLEPGTLVIDHLDFNTQNIWPENLVAACVNCKNRRSRKRDNTFIEPDEPIVLVNGRPTRAVTRTCPTCGKEFLAAPAKIEQGRGVYCSRDCLYARNQPRDKSGA